MITLAELPQASEVMSEAADILDRCGKWWVASGTALGLVRDGGLIPHDTDLDFEMLGEPGSAWLDAVEAEFLASGFAHARRTPFQRVVAKRDVLVDVTFWYVDGDLVCDHDWGQMRQPAHLFDDLTSVEFAGRTYPLPSPADEYMLIRYGEGWRIPDDRFESGHLYAANLVIA